MPITFEGESQPNWTERYLSLSHSGSRDKIHSVTSVEEAGQAVWWWIYILEKDLLFSLSWKTPSKDQNLGKPTLMQSRWQVWFCYFGSLAFPTFSRPTSPHTSALRLCFACVASEDLRWQLGNMRHGAGAVHKQQQQYNVIWMEKWVCGSPECK